VRSRSRMRPEPLRTSVLLARGNSGKKTFAPRSSVLAPLAERIQRALVLAAYVVVRHGPVYAPLLDRLERELDAARRNDPTDRAKHILATYAPDSSHMRPGATTNGLARGRSRRVQHSRATGPRD
jgi:hypothetical protein